MSVHVPNEEDKKRTFTREQVEEWQRRTNAGSAGEIEGPAVDPDYAEFMAWKAAQKTPNQPSLVYGCSDCGKHFNSAQGLRMHRTKIHPAPAS